MFWGAIQSDPALQQKLQGVTEPAAIVDIAKEAGFTVSEQELQKALEGLQDEELKGAAGGWPLPCHMWGWHENNFDETQPLSLEQAKQLKFNSTAESPCAFITSIAQLIPQTASNSTQN